MKHTAHGKCSYSKANINEAHIFFFKLMSLPVNQSPEIENEAQVLQSQALRKTPYPEVLFFFLT